MKPKHFYSRSVSLITEQVRQQIHATPGDSAIYRDWLCTHSIH